jgi:hypothetical protein
MPIDSPSALLAIRVEPLCEVQAADPFNAGIKAGG